MLNDHRHWDTQPDNSPVTLMPWQCSHFAIFTPVPLHGGGEFPQFHHRPGIVYGDRNMCMSCVLFGPSVTSGLVFVHLQPKQSSKTDVVLSLCADMCYHIYYITYLQTGNNSLVNDQDHRYESRRACFPSPILMELNNAISISYKYVK